MKGMILAGGNLLKYRALSIFRICHIPLGIEMSRLMVIFDQVDGSPTRSLVPSALEKIDPIQAHHLLDPGGGPAAALESRGQVRRVFDALDAFRI